MSPAARPPKTAKKDSLSPASSSSPKAAAPTKSPRSSTTAKPKTTNPEKKSKATTGVAKKTSAPAKAMTVKESTASTTTKASTAKKTSPEKAQSTKTPAAKKTSPQKQSSKAVAKRQPVAPEAIPKNLEYVAPPSATGEEAPPAPLRYAPLVSSSVVLDFLEQSGNVAPTPTLHDALPAILAGNHALILEPQTPSTSLITPVVIVSRLVLGDLPKGQGVLALALYDNQNALKQALESVRSFLEASSLTWTVVDSNAPKDLFENTLLFATKDQIKELDSHNQLFKNLRFIFIEGLNLWCSGNTEPLAWLQSKMSTLSLTAGEDSFCQVVVTAYENTPKVREFLFVNLGEHEAFVKLPQTVNAKNPKQFAHALPATQKFQVLLGHIKTHKPSCSAVIANTRTVAEWIAYKLQGNGIHVFLLTRPVGPEQRRALVEAYEQKKNTQDATNIISVVVATDEAFQHMGIEGLQCLYQFDVPRTPQVFLARLSRIEATARPLSITFICEDYGFYMGAIEDALGFKVPVLRPDPKYFALEDTSDYPLEVDGRVKHLDKDSEERTALKPRLHLVEKDGAVETAPAVHKPRPQTRDTSHETHRESQHREPQQAQHERSPRSEAREPRMQPRPVAQTKTQTTGTSPRLMPRATAQASAPSSNPDGHNSSRDKFTHRDERVRDLAQTMKQAAQHRTQPSPAEQNPSAPKPLLLPKTHGGLSGLAMAMADAVKAGMKASSHAFKEGLHAHGGSLVPAPISLAWDFFKGKVFGKSSGHSDQPKGK